MQSIEKHIIDLFRKHDCVIVPDFGGFLLTYKSARFSPAGEELLPPGRIVSFNRSLTGNDGLLATTLSQSGNISYSEAMLQLNEKTRLWKEQLASNREVRLDDIGVISSNSEGKWQFQAASTQNFLVSSFGLSSIQLRLEEAPEFIGDDNQYEDLKLRKTRTISPLTRTLAIAASILIVVGCFGFFFNSYYKGFSGIAGIGNIFSQRENITPKTEVKTPSPVVSTPAPVKEEASTEKDVKPSEEVKSEPKTETPSASVEASSVNNEPVIVKKKAVAPLMSYPPSNEKIEEIDNIESGFYVIGACFTMKSNALRYVKNLKHKGYKAEIIHNNSGLFRVSYHMEQDSLAADEFKKTIHEKDNESAWLLHVN